MLLIAAELIVRQNEKRRVWFVKVECVYPAEYHTAFLNGGCNLKYAEIDALVSAKSVLCLSVL